MGKRNRRRGRKQTSKPDDNITEKEVLNMIETGEMREAIDEYAATIEEYKESIAKMPRPIRRFMARGMGKVSSLLNKTLSIYNGLADEVQSKGLDSGKPPTPEVAKKEEEEKE